MRIIGSLFLTVVFLFLMNRSLTGPQIHEYLALFFGVILILHLLYTKTWRRRVFCQNALGSYVKDFLHMLFFFVLLITMVSGALISTSLFPSVHLRGIVLSIWVHEIHQSAGYGSFIFAGIHYGLHWKKIWARVKKYFGFFSCKKQYKYIGLGTACIFIAYAVYASFLNHIGDRILMEHMVNIGGDDSALKYTGNMWMIFFGYAIFSGLLQYFMEKR